MRVNELVQFGAVGLARLIRDRQVDPIEVVDAHISQIQNVNPRINALITATFDEARKEADALVGCPRAKCLISRCWAFRSP